MAKLQGKHIQKRQKHGIWKQSLIWWLMISASIPTTVVLVLYTAPLYKDRFEGKNNEKFCKKIVEEEMTLPEINVHSTSGSHPIFDDSIINLDHGDPTMFEGFWQSVGDEATVVIPGWQTLSYFSNVSNVCWFLEPKFDAEVRRVHKLVGNAVSEGRHIIVGAGSSQLYQAALYALSPPDAFEPMSVVSAVPYYSSYPLKTDFLRSGLYRWAGDARKFNGESYIEVVCAPNNPDGFINKPILNSEGGKTVYDLAYYWPQYTAIGEPADHDILLFTVSKSTGHAGSRLGWAIVKDPDVAKKMTKFVELNTIGVSKEAQLRAAKVLKVISDGYEHPNANPIIKFFDYGRSKLADRWSRLRAVIKTSNYFSLPDYLVESCNFTGEKVAAYPPFAWLKCEKEDIEDTANFLKNLKILTRGGGHFGAEGKYARVSMLDRDRSFELLIERLASLE